MYVAYAHIYMQCTYCVYAFLFLLRLATPLRVILNGSLRGRTGIPPKAGAKGVAAKAVAKAAFAGKAKSQSAGLTKGGGAGP